MKEILILELILLQFDTETPIEIIFVKFQLFASIFPDIIHRTDLKVKSINIKQRRRK